MEASKADWDTLFERCPFFDSYKNYLQIDITAENSDDLRQWKGWVESRLRQLTLKVWQCIIYLFIVKSHFLLLKGLHKTVLSVSNSYITNLAVLKTSRLRGTLMVCFNVIHILVNSQTSLDLFITVTSWVCSVSKEFQ